VRIGADREATFNQGNGALYMAVDYQVFASIYLTADLDGLADDGDGTISCIHWCLPAVAEASLPELYARSKGNRNRQNRLDREHGPRM
jgi:hypothetical protein